MGAHVGPLVRIRHLVFTFCLALGGLLALSFNIHRLSRSTSRRDFLPDDLTVRRCQTLFIPSVDVLLDLFDLLVSALLAQAVFRCF